MWAGQRRHNAMTRLTTEHLRTDVGRTAALVSQHIVLVHESFAQTEVSDGHVSRAVVKHDVSQLQVAMHDVLLQNKQVTVNSNFIP